MAIKNISHPKEDVPIEIQNVFILLFVTKKNLNEFLILKPQVIIY